MVPRSKFFLKSMIFLEISAEFKGISRKLQEKLVPQLHSYFVHHLKMKTTGLENGHQRFGFALVNGVWKLAVMCRGNPEMCGARRNTWGSSQIPAFKTMVDTSQNSPFCERI